MLCATSTIGVTVCSPGASCPTMYMSWFACESTTIISCRTIVNLNVPCDTSRKIRIRRGYTTGDGFGWVGETPTRQPARRRRYENRELPGDDQPFRRSV